MSSHCVYGNLIQAMCVTISIVWPSCQVKGLILISKQILPSRHIFFDHHLLGVPISTLLTFNRLKVRWRAFCHLTTSITLALHTGPVLWPWIYRPCIAQEQREYPGGECGGNVGETQPRQPSSRYLLSGTETEDEGEDRLCGEWAWSVRWVTESLYDDRYKPAYLSNLLQICHARY